MKITQVIQTPQGEVNYSGTLSQQEADLVVGIGLQYLVGRGVLNLKQETNTANGKIVLQN